MALTQLQISNVRNLLQVRLQGLKGVNVFFGCNGSGKTSVLESIHLLGMARSFRGSSVKSLINHESPSCTVFGMTVLDSPPPVAEEGAVGVGVGTPVVCSATVVVKRKSR